MYYFCPLLPFLLDRALRHLKLYDADQHPRHAVQWSHGHRPDHRVVLDCSGFAALIDLGEKSRSDDLEWWQDHWGHCLLHFHIRDSDSHRLEGGQAGNPLAWWPWVAWLGERG